MSRRVRRCSVCPKFERGGWCVHLATMRPPDAPSCEFGRKVMNNETTKAINRKRFGWKKREPRKREENLES